MHVTTSVNVQMYEIQLAGGRRPTTGVFNLHMYLQVIYIA